MARSVEAIPRSGVRCDSMIDASTVEEAGFEKE